MNALIIDDEKLVAEDLKRLIAEYCPEIENTYLTDSVSEALQYLNKNQVEIVFSDIEMPDLNGFEFIQSIKEISKAMVIFVSAYKQYSLQAFNTEVVHYLLKPVEPKELIKAVQKTKKQLKRIQPVKQTEERIAVFNGNDYLLIPIKDIIRIEADGSYSMIVLANQAPLLVTKSFRHYVEQLGDKCFLKPHRSHLINQNYLLKYTQTDGGYLTLKNGDIIPVSRGRKKEVKTFIDQFE